MEGVTTFFLTQGVLGVTVFVLGTVIYLQDKRHRSDMKEKELTISGLQEKRTLEAGQYARDFITTSQELLQQLRAVLSISTANQEALKTIANILMNIKK